MQSGFYQRCQKVEKIGESLQTSEEIFNVIHYITTQSTKIRGTHRHFQTYEDAENLPPMHTLCFRKLLENILQLSKDIKQERGRFDPRSKGSKLGKQCREIPGCWQGGSEGSGCEGCKKIKNDTN